MDAIPPHVLAHINASEGEILYHKKLTSNVAFYKNKKREIRKHFVVTTTNLIFLDYQSFPFSITQCYREKDVVPIANIEAICCEMKNLFMAKRPFLQIRSDKNMFEIAFSSFGNYTAEMHEIVDLLKGLNPKIQTTLNIAEMPWQYWQ